MANNIDLEMSLCFSSFYSHRKKIILSLQLLIEYKITLFLFLI